MKYSTLFFFTLGGYFTLSTALPVSFDSPPIVLHRRQQQQLSRETIVRLAPQSLGSQPNNNPNRFGDCDGPSLNGKIAKVPCACPPLQADFLNALVRDVQAGFAVNNPSVKISYPTDDSVNSRKARITASIITLQNLNGPGRGCPGVSTTLSLQSAAIDRGEQFIPPAAPQAPIVNNPSPVVSSSSSSRAATPTPSPSPPTPQPVNNNPRLTPELIASLAPQLGSQPNNNRNQFGDCDGPSLNGKIARVPCACPPLRPDFLKALTRDVQAGFAVNNPSVKISFPTDDSVASKKARITASIITLQNLNGPGRGCPGVSTTLSLQADELNKVPASAPAPKPAPQVPAPAPAPAPAPVSSSSASSTVPRPSQSPVAAPPAPVNNGGLTREVVARLAPALGSKPNNNPNQFGDCDGPSLNGRIAKVPCSCPPLPDDFINALTRDVQAGFAVNNPSVKVSFPTDDSVASKKARITASIITLQNLNGPGRGCPGVSTTLSLQSAALDAPQPAPPVQAPAPVPAPAPVSQTPAPAPAPVNNGGLTREVVARLAPELGSKPNNNRNQFGDCDGPSLNGKIAKVPCACPPLPDDFINALTRDVQAGFAVNNPSVKVSFPTDDSVASKKARITASIITLQNLNGPGRGCPGVSTTLSLQAAALG